MGGKISFIVFILVALVLCTMTLGQANAAADMDKSIYDTMLKKYVSDGTVDYLKWKKNDIGDFEQYIHSLARVSLTNLSKNERKAFWINAYNALTIYAVLKHIPANGLLAKVFSVQMVPGFFDKITYSVAGETLTLNDIETKKLRGVFRDPRIHFVLVCASRSCPKIENAIFKAEGFKERLDSAARNFIRDTSRNRLDQKTNILYLSEIFRWYASDFVADSGSVIGYVKKYLLPEDRDYLESNKPELKYLFYNWLVNIKR